MADWLTDSLKKVFLAGVGAVATVSEKAEEVVGELVKKGELTVEQGKVVSEELAQNIKAKCAEFTQNAPSADDIMDTLEHFSAEQRAALKARLEDLEKSDLNG